MQGFLFTSDPGREIGAVAARVEIISSSWSRDHQEISARVIKMLRGSSSAVLIRMRPREASSCDLVPSAGEVGIAAGRLISASRAEVVIEPARPPAGSTGRADQRRCTDDGLIHAEVSPDIARHVTDGIRTLEKGARLRDVAKLDLPCGFHIDPRFGWNLVLTNGAEIRRYAENNPFGFAPAFGFGEKAIRPYTLQYKVVAAADLHPDDCLDRLKSVKADLQLCSSFGSRTSLFGTASGGPTTRLAHYVLRGSRFEEDFPVAEIAGHVESIFFLPPPDAAGGTITIILSDSQGTYRAYLDVPRG
jgi:hypothetical protein